MSDFSGILDGTRTRARAGTATIFGQVTTKDKQCQFMPTIGSTVVP